MLAPNSFNFEIVPPAPNSPSSVWGDKINTFLKDNNNIVTVITDYKKAISNLEKNIDLYKNQVSSLKI